MRQSATKSKIEIGKVQRLSNPKEKEVEYVKKKRQKCGATQVVDDIV